MMATPPSCTVGTTSFEFRPSVGFTHFSMCVSDGRARIGVSSEKMTCFHCCTVCARATMCQSKVQPLSLVCTGQQRLSDGVHSFQSFIMQHITGGSSTSMDDVESCSVFNVVCGGLDITS
ncbi:hypothetical protein EON63_22445 [archaeon]|nr:MAG: hypothetical protein EON63_22445 [archaeon]